MGKRLNVKRLVIIIILFILLFICAGLGMFFYGLRAVSDENKTVDFVVESGNNR